MFVWWNWLVEKDVGGLALGALLLALATAITKIRRDAAEIRKLRAEARQIDADASAIRRRDCISDREGVRNCARNILRSVSALVDELYETFSLFAFPPAKIDRVKLRQAVGVAQRFRHEQRYRVEMEGLLAELAAFARVESNGSLGELASQAHRLLTKVGDKKSLLARIEQAGLNADTTAAVRSWLGEVRELQIGLSTSVGTIVSQLALASSDAIAS